MFDEKIVGVVDRIVFKNDENGYHVLRIRSNEKDITVTTNQLKIHEGTTMEFVGQWANNSKFGTQFKASKATEVAPQTKDAFVKYLSSSFFKGIGPVIAKKIVKHFGDEIMDVLKNDIDKLLKVPGISKKKLEGIKASWVANSEINEIMVFLQNYNISTLFATKIYETYGKDCISKIRENPYKLAEDIKGVGFKSADALAISLGFAKDSKERIRAAIGYVLSEGENDGHCYLLYEQLLDKTTALLNVRIKEKIDEILELMIDNNEIKKSNISNEDRYYSNIIFYNERYCAEKIDVLRNVVKHHDKKIIKDWADSVSKNADLEVDFGNNDEKVYREINLSDGQMECILGIIENNISCLIGGPGTGKTQTLKHLIKLLDALGVKYALCSPTGRAAQRMSELTGVDSQTIHRLLKVDPMSGHFVHNEINQIVDYDVFIIDESSMIDVNLAASLLRAIPDDCQILFIGDVDQLPPVGPGNFLKDLIDSGFVKTFKLTKIFRQKEGSEIIQFSSDIRNGIEPNIESPLVTPEMWKNKNSCMFIDSDLRDSSKSRTDYPDWNSLYYGIDILEMIKKLYTETINKYYPNREVQIIIPQNIGSIGTKNVNKVIQEAVNPESSNKPEIKIGDNILRKFDKIIVTKNSYEYGIMNGDIGVIKEINPEEKSCIIEFGCENKTVELKKDGLLLIRLAYAISVHKSQGSEFDVVIFPITMSFYNMLYKQLIYTGISRAKKLCVFVGNRTALLKAVHNTDQSKRNTSLIELLEMRKKKELPSSF